MSKEEEIKFRTAPRVGSLKDLERYIKFLTFEIVPYTFIDGKNLLAKKQNNLITNEEYEEILEWKKQVGDIINKDETLLEISTDKVDSEIPSSHSGIVTELLAGPNDVIEVGKVMDGVIKNITDFIPHRFKKK